MDDTREISAGAVTETRLVIYGYSIFDYVRKYDRVWQWNLQRLKKLLKDHTQFRNSRMNEIATECLFHILSYLNAWDLLSTAQVNLEWNQLSVKEELWNGLLKSKFGLSLHEMKVTKKAFNRTGNISSKELFGIMERNFRALVHVNPGFKTRPIIPATLLA
jgi:hypothetical protein